MPESRWRRAAGDALAALVVSLAALSFYLSAASLLFQGALRVHLPVIIGAVFFGAVVQGLIGAWRSALPIASLGAVPSMVSVQAAVAAATAAAVSQPQALLPTVLLALLATGALTGAAWCLLGRFGGGTLMRFLPFPVVGGFLAATGWLMLTGGLGVAMGEGFNWSRAAAWLQGLPDARLAVAVLMGVAVWRLQARWSHPLALPVLLVASAALIHGGLWLAGLDVHQARASGWLLQPFERTAPAWPWQPALLQAVEWGVLLHQLPLMGSAVVVATLGQLLTSSSLELSWDTPVDFNADLRLLGASNLVAVGLGGLAGGTSISRSLLNAASGARSRWSAVFLALLCAAAMVWGGPFVGWMPAPLLGGLLIFLALDVLKTWLWDSRRRLNRWDHATVVAMVVATALAGFLPAVLLGIVACCAAFVVGTSRLPPLRRLLTRRAWPSRVERPVAEAEWLQAHGDGLLIAELQGLLFFGSATRLTQQLAEHLQGPHRPLQLLLDFTHVQGLDSSAAQTLSRLASSARRGGVALAYAQVRDDHWAVLASAGACGAQTERHADIDEAVQRWDDAWLADRTAAQVPAFRSALQQQLPAGVTLDALLARFTPRTLAPGEVLFTSGAAADALYLVETGQLSVFVSDGDGAERWVRTVMAGSAVGEMGLFRGTPRSATVRAETACRLWVLGAAALERLAEDDPRLSAALYRLFVLQMASRVDQLTAQAHALAR